MLFGVFITKRDIYIAQYFDYERDEYPGCWLKDFGTFGEASSYALETFRETGIPISEGTLREIVADGTITPEDVIAMYKQLKK
jgi:hypothetical protein